MICRPSPPLAPRSARARDHLLGPLFASLVASQISACAWIDDESLYGDEEPTLSLLESFPANGAVGVEAKSQIDFCFSRTIDPKSVGTFDVILVSGVNIFDVEVSLQLFAWRPPAGQGALPEEPWCPGSVLTLRPRSEMRGDADYRVRLRPFVVGWGGESLDLLREPWEQLDDGRWATYVEFRVAPEVSDEDPGEGAPEPAPITLSDLYDAGGPFDPARALCSCHGVDGDLAHERLDLSTPELAFEGLVLDQELASTGYPRVTPAQPSESFLIHKLVRDPDGAPLHAVRGAVMPPNEPLEYPDMVMIARWIEDGALP